MFNEKMFRNEGFIFKVQAKKRSFSFPFMFLISHKALLYDFCFLARRSFCWNKGTFLSFSDMLA